jgi:hypothetical protein
MRRWILLAIVLGATTSCSRVVYEAHFAAPAQLAKITEAASRAPFIKCHMPDGRVFVLQQWTIEEGSGVIEGFGIEYDADRTAKPPQRHNLKLEEVAIIETNRPYQVDVATGPVIGLAIGTGVSFAFSVGCLATLKKAPCW